MLDNAFLEIEDWGRAQRSADRWRLKRIHSKLDQFASRFCPLLRHFKTDHHWSVNQCEYASDIVFRRQADLPAIHGNLTRTAIHKVQPGNIATLLGRKLAGNCQDEMGDRFNIRMEGRRIKNTMWQVSLNLCYKLALILRLETTLDDLSFFKHCRKAEHRDGSHETKWASMRKSIDSLPALRELLAAANRRYLEFLSTLEAPPVGRDKLHKLSRTVLENDRCHGGFNFFDDEDPALLEAIARGEFNLSGLQNQTLRRHLSAKSSGQISGLLKRLRVHGLIQKISRACKYYLTQFGKQIIAAGLKLKQRVIIPQLAFSPTR